MVKQKLLCGNIQKSVIYQRNLKLRKRFQSLKNWQTSFIQSWLKKKGKRKVQPLLSIKFYISRYFLKNSSTYQFLK